MIATTWLLLVALMGSPPASQTPSVGKAVPAFSLRDFHGNTHALDDVRSDLVVVAFLGVDCPLANRYATRLNELARRYQPRGVAFLAIDSNQQDSLAQLARFAEEHSLAFPFLKDPGSRVADQFGATRTPEVFLLDGRRVVRYQGRIDDQYGTGYTRAALTRQDLAAALDELLAGKPVSHPLAAAQGCYIGRVERRPARGPVAYTKQIAGILDRHCATCHHAGAVAPFPLTSYAETAGWAETIAEVVQDGRMPPWDADPCHGIFANDPSLNADEKRLLLEWVRNGAPEGNPADRPRPPSFTEGWRIPKPDLVVTMPRPVSVPARGVLPYQYFTVDPGFRQDRWVRASEARAGNPLVVHHIVVLVQRPGDPSPADRGGLGDTIAMGVPGMPPIIYPEGHARLIPAGSKLVFQMHYTPNGTPQTDQSRVGLVFADPKTVRRQIHSELAVNFDLRIPPHAADYAAFAVSDCQQDTLLYSLFPHMHLRGKSFQIEAAYPDGRREVLLNVPRYRFDWQNQYALAQPKWLPARTRLICRGHFDNSETNPSNPDPTATVRFGVQTWDEMLVGYFETAPAHQDLRLGRPQVHALENGRCEVTFHYLAPPGTKAVYLAGSFNGWKPTGHAMTGPDAAGRFTTRVTLKPGVYEYKYVLDGKTWRSDPGNPDLAGYFQNSVLTVARQAKRQAGRP